jgi:hypothetical protein
MNSENRRVPVSEARRQAVSSGEPKQIAEALESLKAQEIIQVQTFVDYLAETDKSVLEEKKKQALQKAIFDFLDVTIERPSISLVNPAQRRLSTHFDIKNVFILFLRSGKDGKLDEEHINTFWTRHKDNLIKIEQILLDAVIHGFPKALGWMMPMVKTLDAEKRAQMISATNQNDGSTVLTAAIRSCNVDFVHFLLNQDTKPRFIDLRESTVSKDSPLHTVVRDTRLLKEHPIPETEISKRIEIAKALIERKPTLLFAHDSDGNPPYYYARTDKNFEHNIATVLRDCIIRDLSEVFDIRQALYGSKGKASSYHRDVNSC